MEKKEKRGGIRPNQTGRPKADPLKKRHTLHLSISKENIDFLTHHTDDKNAYVNMMLDKARIEHGKFLQAVDKNKQAPWVK